MKKVFLLACMTAAGASVMMADVPAPVELDDVFMTALSANGQYAVSQGSYQLKFINLATGQIDVLMDESGMSIPSAGAGNCISDNGIMVGTTDDMNAQYLKDGEWYDLDVPAEATYVNLAQAITPDGSRICGTLGMNALSYDDDTLMQVPCIWDATADGFGSPVILPYPDKDFTGRIPMYITATDISADGKIVVGQVVNSTGMVSYPIVYKQSADGSWSYEIPDADLLKYKGGEEYPAYPSVAPVYPQMEDFMSAEELAAYEQAYLDWQLSGYQSDLYPNVDDYMTDAEKEAYNNAMAEYNEAYDTWAEEFNAWYELLFTYMDKVPYVFNSMRMGPDGKTFGGTVMIEKQGDDSWSTETLMNVWVTDIATGKCTKYNQNADMNLTYLGNEGVALASTSVYTASNSWVLKDGKFNTMYYWMYSQCPEYSMWMKEHMTFTYETFDYETWETTEVTELMSGRAIGTPNLEVVGLTVQNTWDWEDDGLGYIFKVGEASSVKNVEVENNGETVIYDLQGRKLNDAVAPGIYIINGEKKVVR